MKIMNNKQMIAQLIANVYRNGEDLIISKVIDDTVFGFQLEIKDDSVDIVVIKESECFIEKINVNYFVDVKFINDIEFIASKINTCAYYVNDEVLNQKTNFKFQTPHVYEDGLKLVEFKIHAMFLALSEN